MSRVAVALSGGVDSAVTAAILKEQGFEVFGITAKIFCSTDSERIISNAKSVADKLGIEHFVYDASLEFNNRIIKYFTDTYKKGLTPNPCIMCNKHIKWGTLFEYVTNELNADMFATGHYANIVNDGGVYKLHPAKDEQKDQLYFLFLLNQAHLAKTLFPLSKLRKDNVRKLAEKYNLPVKSAKESQDICFIKPPMTTKKYLNSILPNQKGAFVEKKTGKVLGSHDGFWQYTVGQRKGIGLAAEEAFYVLGVDPASNTVFVGFKNELESNSLILDNFNWSYHVLDKNFEALVKIRYNMKPIRAIINIGETVNIEFLEAVSGIAPGQACVLYDINDGHLLGGGFI